MTTNLRTELNVCSEPEGLDDLLSNASREWPETTLAAESTWFGR